ncbi:uncharacterized protein FIBRA_03359 [Fibroporia radiculosa]|uniref:SprT-like domain-containing protein n=1 Tax=Fibroporia radiculosa TaxID=599839 RepID=J4GNF7_9APHY|nr:uncharacterized protein FIBRA_03359 [Fibroporia radiculosa]CCM01310.1 predicted protein [Fibroporia radiculosa]
MSKGGGPLGAAPVTSLYPLSPAADALTARFQRFQCTKPSEEGEVIPDSEEERLRPSTQHESKLPGRRYSNVIEISSDEDDVPTCARPRLCPRTPKANDFATPRRRRIRILNSPSSDKNVETKPAIPRKQGKVSCTPVKPTEVVIDLTYSSPDEDEDSPAKRQSTKRSVLVTPLCVNDSNENNDDDGAILVLNEPPRARKPIMRVRIDDEPNADPFAACTPVSRAPSDSDSESDPKAIARVSKRAPASTPQKKTGRPPRLTKKALAAAEQARRESYARELFDELNHEIFEGGIPSETQLKWSNRLLTTAGRARWHRSKDGVQTSEIELATKVLDCDERIRNTLSHEMCHLACWIINENPKEAHGPTFQKWARDVMRARPEIEVTTRHDYEITYKYQWKCQQCDKIYGRHSKSIRPDECVCGACNEGKLIPLFDTPQRAPRTPKNKAGSQLAASKSRDSPLAVPSPVGDADAVDVQDTPVRSRSGLASLPESLVRAGDSDIETLAHVFGAISITSDRSA